MATTLNYQRVRLSAPIFRLLPLFFSQLNKGKTFFNIVSGRKPLPEGQQAGLVYSRFNNPTLEIAENRIAVWDEAEDCVVTGSGMSAISTMLMTFAEPGDVIVYSEPIYGGTDTLVNVILKK